MNTADIPRLPRRLILLVTPLALAVLELTHPPTPTEANAGWWVAIHVIQLPLFGLFALGVLLLLDGVHGLAATTSRIALGVFVIFYTALDATAGIAAGILLEHQRGLAPAPHSGAAHALDAFFTDPVRLGIVNIGYAGLIVGVLAACMALASIPRLRLPLGILLAGALLIVADWGVDIPHIGPLHMIGWTLCVLAGAYALFSAAAPRFPLVVPLVLLAAVPPLLALMQDDPNGTVGLIVGALAVAIALVLAARGRVLLGDGPNARLYPLVALALTAAVLGWDHSAPFGPVGFTAFFIAAAWLDRRQQEAGSARTTKAATPEPDLAV
ncbi:MAG TPA: hypothetical protein VGR57_20750 [Ktedonobacterales bacterium]|nr:hypothetical protein [Ktedonobacterales bacterium]